MGFVMFAAGLLMVQSVFFFLTHRAGRHRGWIDGHVAGSAAERARYLANREHLEKVHGEQLRRLQEELNAARAALAWGPYRRLERRAN